MLQMEMILPDLTTSINSALQSRNPAVVCDSLALINQFLIVGKVDLALNILQKPVSSVLTTALKNQSIQVRIKASCVACQLLLKCRGDDPLGLFPTLVLLLSDPDEVLRRNALAAASNLVYFKVPPQFESLIGFFSRQLDSPNPKIRAQCLEGLSHVPQHGENYIHHLHEKQIFHKITKLVLTESSSMVLQPLIQRILRVFCTFKEIRNIFVDIRLADNLQALVDRQMANESKNRTGPGKSFRQSGFHAQILRLIQILKS